MIDINQRGLVVDKHSVSFRMYDRKFRQRDLEVVHELSIAVRPGEIVAIAGASGSGKSVLAHSILGILPDNAFATDTIYYDGKLLSQRDKESFRGRKITLIPQSVNYLDPLMTVGAQIITPAAGDGGKAGRRKKAAALLERYGLAGEVLDYYPFQLSGGMARRVLVSSAAACPAEMIIADEPTPGMDKKAVDETIRLFRQLADEGRGIMLITHDIEMAVLAANRVAVFREGTVIETVPAAAFSGDGSDLSHPFTRALYRALPQNGFSGDFKEAV
ncbi:MAG: ATP-binding cassette domain-containing protein [Treponema sp.]|jgi:peptide/nickel transport system ATP-binding protein|nr:ATP-binding cassette domain-containing protein [Treponema sp.]